MTEPDGPAWEETLASASRALATGLGLRVSPTVAGRLSRSVVEEAQAHRLDLASYGRRVETDPALFQGLVNRVTVQETSFFRDPGQLEAFRDGVLPGLASPVHIWSAGCSNGQEPYTLAMILMESGVDDWRVMATDVSTRALERTRLARYSAKEVKSVPPQLRARYFRPVADEWLVADELRERVRVAQNNIVADPPPFPPGGCDVLFCRNVLIYMAHEPMVLILERVARWLRPPGWLFLGYSESLLQVTTAFELVRVGEGFAYRLAQPGAAPAGPAIARPAAGRTGRPVPGTSGPTRGPQTPSRQPPPPQWPNDGALLLTGQEAMNGGDFGAAVVAFRKLVYLEPDQPVAHLHLGLALEAAGDLDAALRVFAAARAMLGSGAHAGLESTLKGYRVVELARMLDAKLAAR